MAKQIEGATPKTPRENMLLTALKSSEIFCNAYLCPFQIPMNEYSLNMCNCNYHGTARDIHAAIAKAEGRS